MRKLENFVATEPQPMSSEISLFYCPLGFNVGDNNIFSWRYFSELFSYIDLIFFVLQSCSRDRV